MIDDHIWPQNNVLIDNNHRVRLADFGLMSSVWNEMKDLYSYASVPLEGGIYDVGHFKLLSYQDMMVRKNTVRHRNR
jgi:hypothetical protein